MKIPNKIGIIDTVDTIHTRLRFDDWEGTVPENQVKHLALKLNELIDYLHQVPQIPNELPGKVKREGNQVVHEHHYRTLFRLGNREFTECAECGDTLEKVVGGN